MPLCENSLCLLVGGFSASLSMGSLCFRLWGLFVLGCGDALCLSAGHLSVSEWPILFVCLWELAVCVLWGFRVLTVGT